MVGQHEVRLFGIDAPEAKQTCLRDGQPWACGAESADQLSRQVSGKQVTCVAVGSDKYRRIVARCGVGGKISIGTWSRRATRWPIAATRTIMSLPKRPPR